MEENVLEIDAEPEKVCGVIDRRVLKDREGELETVYDGLSEGDAELDRDPLPHAVCELDAKGERESDEVTLEVVTARLDTETLRDIVTVGVVDEEIEAENDGELVLKAVLDNVKRPGEPEEVEHTLTVGDREGEMVAEAVCDGDTDSVKTPDTDDVIDCVVDSVLVKDIVGDALKDDDSVPETESVGL